MNIMEKISASSQEGRSRITKLIVFAAGPLLVLSVPLGTSNPYILRIIIILFIYSIMAVSLNLIMGLTGLLSISHAAFFGIGAYTSALLSLRIGLSFWLCLPAAAIVSALFALMIGFPVLRLKGHYLALATLAFNEIVKLVIYNWDGLTRGASGLPNIPPPRIFSFQFTSQLSYYYLTFFFLLLTVALIGRIFYSDFGRALRSLKEDEVISQALGIEVMQYKVLAFLIGGLFAGLAGSLYAHYNTFVSAQITDVFESVLIIVMVFIGGAGSILGSLAGAVLVILLPEVLRGLEAYRMLIFGSILILVMMFYPHGLLGKLGPPIEHSFFSPLRRFS